MTKLENSRERYHYLEQLVSEFKESTAIEIKEQVLANLANFSYDPGNYEHMKRLNVVNLFLDQLGESNDHLVEFAMGGLCNLCNDSTLRKKITHYNGVEKIIRCLSSHTEETVISALTCLIFLYGEDTKELTSPSVLNCMGQIASSRNPRLSNLANIFLEEFCTPEQISKAREARSAAVIDVPVLQSASFYQT